MSSDLEIIDAVLAGDAASFGTLVARYQKRLLGLLWHATDNRELAEDIAQETFFRAYRKLNLYGRQAHFYTWLARIGLNLLSSYYRKNRVENLLDRVGYEAAVDSVGVHQAPGEPMEQQETQRYVQAALAKLDQPHRQVLLLRDFQDLDYENIAAILGIPIGTVRSRLHRARSELKHLLRDGASQLGLQEDR